MVIERLASWIGLLGPGWLFALALVLVVVVVGFWSTHLDEDGGADTPPDTADRTERAGDDHQ